MVPKNQSWHGPGAGYSVGALRGLEGVGYRRLYRGIAEGREMMSAQVNIVERHKAESGYYVLTVIPQRADEPVKVETQAVLHWGYEKPDQYSIPYPITLCGVVSENVYILRPDGVVEQAEGGYFPSLGAFIQAVTGGHV